MTVLADAIASLFQPPPASQTEYRKLFAAKHNHFSQPHPSSTLHTLGSIYVFYYESKIDDRLGCFTIVDETSIASKSRPQSGSKSKCYMFPEQRPPLDDDAGSWDAGQISVVESGFLDL